MKQKQLMDTNERQIIDRLLEAMQEIRNYGKTNDNWVKVKADIALAEARAALEA
jgi:hypothetical protein